MLVQRFTVIVFCAVFVGVLSLLVSATEPYPTCPGANRPSQPCSASVSKETRPRKYLMHDVNPGIGRLIDKVFYLQHYPSTFTSSNWIEKYEEGSCLEETGYFEESNGEFTGWFWGYNDVVSKEVSCFYVQGSGSTLKPLLQEHSNHTSIMLDRAEVMLHDNFGDPDYWEIRRSMRFSKRLRDVADKFRRDSLNSDDERDGTVLDEDWKVVPNSTGHTLGGPYLAVHLRRQDYVKSRPKDVPDLKWAAEQIKVLLEKQGLKKVFVATDAGDEEFQTLRTYLPEAVRFEPSKELRGELKDGGLAIVDQWIAAHARKSRQETCLGHARCIAIIWPLLRTKPQQELNTKYDSAVFVHTLLSFTYRYTALAYCHMQSLGFSYVKIPYQLFKISVPFVKLIILKREVNNTAFLEKKNIGWFHCVNRPRENFTKK
ncbi:O-fucosyltransferase 2 isoform X3 [Rhipicephalus microplus]|uniref:O-fucosyltransferase 2 isoform X3 n=1 Tax=Rhipicephalus microplus TaxID=6941 RepID=UPI003F6D32C7